MTGATIILPLSTIEENIDDTPNDHHDDHDDDVELQRTNQQAMDKGPLEQTTHFHEGKRTAIFTLSAFGARSPVFINIIEISFAKLHRK